VAEQEGHHPDLHLAWGRVDVKTSTHDAGGLTESDFILAAKVDRVYFGR
jgi:4a-hydroxytetrahydrobiopterin dehydratase